MKPVKYREVETKYNAENISLTDFTEIAKARNPEKFVLASGYDHFYKNAKDPDAFIRHRIGTDSNQLTFKRKTIDANNNIRTEYNLDFDPHMDKEEAESSAKALCEDLHFSYNSSLFKTCFVYRFSDHILVYYICYDLDMNERGRFIEIEAREDHKWVSEQEAWDTVMVVEKMLKGLGISPQARMKKSLQEMFQK